MAIEEEGSPPLPIPGNMGRRRGERIEHGVRFACNPLAFTLQVKICKLLNKAHGSLYHVSLRTGKYLCATGMRNGWCWGDW